MSGNLTQLERELSQGRWRGANECTRLLFHDRLAVPAEIRQIDFLWKSYSGGVYGFEAQARIWNSLGGPALEPGNDLWEFFRTFGDKVGWRRQGDWIRLVASDESLALAYPFPVLDLSLASVVVPSGCLPFHNVLSNDRGWNGFSPRDCWGEFVWDRWATVFAAVTDGERFG